MMKRVAILFLAVGSLTGVGTIAFGATAASLTVIVKDERGIPVSDAVVMIYPSVAASRPMRFGPSIMAQKNLAFTPGTLIAPKGASVSFPNFDRVRHSIYSFSKAARFEINLYGKDQSRSQSFPIAGNVALGCNIHDQMRGYIKVVDTAFAAKTDRDGKAAFDGLPVGTATIKIWHPLARAQGNEISNKATLAAGNNDRRFALAVRPS